MPRKGDRIVSKRILYIMDKRSGVSMRFTDVVNALAEHHWHHCYSAVSDNLKLLIKEGKIVHIGNQYSLIQKHENGNRFYILRDPALGFEQVVNFE